MGSIRKSAFYLYCWSSVKCVELMALYWTNSLESLASKLFALQRIDACTANTWCSLSSFRSFSAVLLDLHDCIIKINPRVFITFPLCANRKKFCNEVSAIIRAHVRVFYARKFQWSICQSQYISARARLFFRKSTEVQVVRLHSPAKAQIFNWKMSFLPVPYRFKYRIRLALVTLTWFFKRIRAFIFFSRFRFHSISWQKA